MNGSSYTLRIDVIEGSKLAPKDRNGLSDPYIDIQIGEHTYTTQVIDKNLNPRWDASFDHKFNASEPPKEIRFTCWDKDFVGRDYMGEIRFDLLDIWKKNSIGYSDETNKPQWYPLISLKKKEKVSGQILIKIGLVEDKGEKLSLSEWSFIEIVCAKDLPAERNVTGLGFDMDPFVVVSFARNTFRTKIINHNLNPEWNEKFHFPIKKNESKYLIKFTIYDWDKFSGNDLVASQSFPIEELMGDHFKATKETEEDFVEKELPLKVLSREKFNKEYKPTLMIKLKFMSYEQLRSKFWMALAKIYDSDDNGVLDYVEIETMLNSLGSSLTNDTLSTFFTRFAKDPLRDGLEFVELVSCLEKQLEISQKSATDDGEEADNEHVIYIKECPICHKPDLSKLNESDIITHVAICASDDWGKVDSFVTGDFVTESQAQRKWVTKIISKVGFGGYEIGIDSANIIVQDRTTGHVVEEKMATYVRLGIRLLYRGKGASIDSKRTQNVLRSLTLKQGKKYDKPSSTKDIAPFIKFHNLNVDEVLEPQDSFKNFNEFFYRKLKPGARPCDSPDDPHVLVSPADCRMMAFPTIDKATELWIKGQSFSLAKLINDENVAKEFEGGSLGIFRLAPQDYHRFHFPVEGELSEPTQIPGSYYTVNPIAIRSELDVYGENKRAVSYINSPQFGKVAFVAIGAMMDRGDSYFSLFSTPSTHVKRTEEHGYFAFGGSTVVLLFQKGTMFWDEDILENSGSRLETLVRVGMQVGKSAYHH
ncbi:8789_t:CDS:10 [Acaulospora morrowiae]|uniref:Phosphatidylserine decarboxylase proenzyme 2 n=1 Tax=Acaulospora morrowiae TaxID=94023 RepID=A0A9N8YUW3_9GLOM|nr:8789_t:CDS:10 [Acaulospora morrowiae]